MLRILLTLAALLVAPSVARADLVPDQAVSVSVCSAPVTGGSEGILTSSIVCSGGSARVLLEGRFEPRRVGGLTGARWTGWGGATARAVGTARGRRAVAIASSIVDCGGVLAYDTVTVRRGRRTQVLRELAPC